MILSNCSKCTSKEYIIKRTVLYNVDNEKMFQLAKREFYYLKICSNCGYTEMYDEKLVDKNVKKNNARI